MTDQRLPEPPIPPRFRHRTVRDVFVCVGVAILLLVVLKGTSIRSAGEDLEPGWQRTLVLAVGEPAARVTEALGLEEAGDKLTQWASLEDGPATGEGGFAEDEEDAAATAPRPGGVQPVTPEAFDPLELGEPAEAPRTLETVLATGDSMVTPLDARLARRLASGTVETLREPQLGTGISQTDLLDWGSHAVSQVKESNPEAVVVFLGANEGFPLRAGGREVECCGPEWAAAYATRARRMMDTYRQGGEARVYWLLLPGPRDADRARIARAVNAAIRAAAAPYRAHVRVLDMAAVFTPGGRYRDSMEIDGRDRIVRDADGVHLNDAGAELAAEQVLAAMRRDFGQALPR